MIRVDSSTSPAIAAMCKQLQSSCKPRLKRVCAHWRGNMEVEVSLQHESSSGSVLTMMVCMLHSCRGKWRLREDYGTWSWLHRYWPMNWVVASHPKHTNTRSDCRLCVQLLRWLFFFWTSKPRSGHVCEIHPMGIKDHAAFSTGSVHHSSSVHIVLARFEIQDQRLKGDDFSWQNDMGLIPDVSTILTAHLWGSYFCGRKRYRGHWSTVPTRGVQIFPASGISSTFLFDDEQQNIIARYKATSKRMNKPLSSLKSEWCGASYRCFLSNVEV